MQTKMSTALNVVLAIAVVALAINAYDTQQQLDSRLLDSSNAVDKINASIAAIKVHEIEQETKSAAASALMADLIIKMQEQGQIIDDLVAKLPKKK
jgi:putative effector of murein hydrolase